MSIPGSGSPLLLATAGAAAAAAEYVIPKSLRFNSGDSGSLSKTFATTGNRKTWTWSAWVKRSGNNNGGLFGNYYSDDSFGTLFFNSDQLQFSANTTWFKTTQVFRDFSSFFHIVLAVDTTLATAGDRVRLYINGSEVTSFATENNPSQYANLGPDNSAETRIGRDGVNYFNGLLADIQFVDGQALAPTDFGETRSSDGVWVPKEFAGTFSSDPVTIQVGSPSYPSDFTTTGNKTSDQTGLSFGSWSGTYTGANTKIFKASDDSVFSILVDTTGRNDDRLLWYSDNLTDWTYIGNGNAFSPPYTLSGHKYYCTSEGAGDVTLHVSNPTFNSFHLNFSDSSTNEALGFDSAPTTPDPDPKKGFDVITYDGTYARLNVGGLNFEPGLVWIKNRDSGTSAHFLADSVRGGTKVLQSNSTGAENTRSNHILSFNPDGFTLGADGTSNYPSGNSFVAWTWRAGGPAVANTSGTITSQVSANTDYGFSIVTYTGGTSDATIGHGLGQTPKFYIVKARESTAYTDFWSVYHTSLGESAYIKLNETSAATTGSTIWNSTAPTTALFSVDASSIANENNTDYVAYVWSEVSGYSKISGYAGTGANGNKQTTGFKPRWVIIKGTDSTYDWQIFDSERSPSDPRNKILEANTSDAEATSGNNINFLDDGFDFNTTSDKLNGSSKNYIYAAFADRPGNNWDVNNIVTNEGLTTSKTQFDVVTYTGNGGTQKIGGPVYSAGATATGGFNSSYPATNLFNGTLSDSSRAEGNDNDGVIEVVFSPGITVSSTVGIWSGKSSVAYQINDSGSYTTYSDAVSSFKDISFTGTLTNLKIKHGSSGNAPGASGIRVDGTTLLDGTGPGLKFQPDFVWYKHRSGGSSHGLFDSVRGATKYMNSNGTGAEQTVSGVTSFNDDGFTLGSDSGGNGSGTWVAWCWKAGGAAVSNTDGSITSSVSANAQYGFSVLTYTGTGSTATVGHGLGVAPSLYIVKARTTTAANSWRVFVSALGNTKQLFLEDTASASTNSNAWNNTSPTSSVFSVGSLANESSGDYVAYCFANVPGYQRIGSWVGGGSTDVTVVTGFKPRFVLAKNASGLFNWFIADSERATSNPFDELLYANTSEAETTSGVGDHIRFNSDGFTIEGNANTLNQSGSTFVYLAIGDDEIGSDEDCLVDVPNAVTADADATDTTGGYQRGNYATFNAIEDAAGGGNASLSDGNLQIDGSSSEQFRAATIPVSSGKWYFEIIQSAGTDFGPGVWAYPLASPSSQFYQNENYRYNSNGGLYDESAKITDYSSFAVGDVIGTALDMDNGKVYFSKNGIWQNSGNPVAGTNPAASGLTGQWIFGASTNGNSTVLNANFGQQRFKYPMPTGFSSLNTTALPAATIEDGSAYFDAKLHTGNGSTQTISGFEFSPDFVWVKQRNTSRDHRVANIISGTGKDLRANANNAEITDANGITAFNSDGFSVGSSTGWNQSSGTYVSWCWDAGTSTVSNTDGSVSASVRANQAAGFSICTFTSPSSGNFTIGHGLNAVPEFVLVKTRGATSDWSVYHKSISTTTSKYLILNTTIAVDTYNYVWGAALPTTSVVGLTSGGAVATSQTCVAYCFTSVAGYSAFGSYEGNGSSDGPFVYTGFRPALVIIKRTDSAEQWYLNDTARDTFNVTGKSLRAQSGGAEASTGGSNSATWDILSNGFKLRDSGGGSNASGGDYIYMAWAENPFQANGGLAR